MLIAAAEQLSTRDIILGSFVCPGIPLGLFLYFLFSGRRGG